MKHPEEQAITILGMMIIGLIGIMFQDIAIGAMWIGIMSSMLLIGCWLDRRKK